MRIVKWFLSGIFVIIVLLLATPFVILATVDQQSYKDLIQDTVREKTGRELALNGDISAKLSLQPRFVIEDVTLSNADWATGSHFLKLDRLEAELSIPPLLSGKAELTHLSLEGGELHIEKNAQGELNLPLPTSKADATDAPAQETAADSSPSPEKKDAFSLKQIALNGLTLHYKDHATNEAHSLNIRELSGANISQSKADITGLEIIWNDAASLTGQVEMRDENAALNLQAKTLKGDNVIRIQGNVQHVTSTPNAALDLAISLNDPSQLEAIKAGLGSTPPLSLTTSIKGGKEAVKLNDLVLNLADQTLKADADIALNGSRPFVKATVSADSLALAALSKSNASSETQKAPAEASAATKGGRAIPDIAFPFDALKGFDSDITVAINSLEASSALTLQALQAKALVKNGALQLSPFNAQIASGTLESAVSLSPANGLSVKLNADGLDLGNLLAQSGIDDLTAANTQLQLEMKGKGASLHSWLDNAKGDFYFYSKDAKYKIPESLRNNAGLLGALIPEAAQKDQLDIACFVTGWDIKNGAANANLFTAKTPIALVNGEGTVSLKKENLSMNFNSQSTLIGFADVIPAIKVSGPWRNVSVGTDAQSTLLTAGKWALGGASGAGLASLLGEQEADKPGVTTNPCISSEDLETIKAAEERNKENPLKSAEDTVRNIRDNVLGEGKDIEDTVKGIRDGFKNLEGFKNLF